ncbi:transcriptional regulator [Thermoplasmatales archaeon SG8-52-1]|nr:MAG: transcriptional regulator [Thermoplasmatales archaeon SG8-52-1]
MVEGAVPRFWREIPQRYNLIGNKCSECGKIFFPPRESCPDCRRKSIGKLKEYKLSGNGIVETYTIICDAPEKFEGQAPYPIAIIKLDEGPKLTAQIVDCDNNKIKIGMRVKSTFRKIQDDGYVGAIYYGYKFKPVEGSI